MEKNKLTKCMVGVAIITTFIAGAIVGAVYQERTSFPKRGFETELRFEYKTTYLHGGSNNNGIWQPYCIENKTETVYKCWGDIGSCYKKCYCEDETLHCTCSGNCLSGIIGG